MKHLPLSHRALDDIILLHNSQGVSCSRFVGLCQSLARQMPEQPMVINLCEDRLAFSVSFCATLLAGGANLLPANRLPASVEQIVSKWPQAIIITDQNHSGRHNSAIAIQDLLTQHPQSDEMPSISADQLAAVVYTSGSSGAASEITKSWRVLYHSSLINMAEYGPGQLTHALATVPPQHMWGLETTVLAPLFGPLIMSPEQPLFATDIIAALNQMASPRALISTPVHLRALLMSGIALPPIDRIYSATAPLPANMAQRLEQSTGAHVMDIYGCSEVGCLAKRAPAHDEDWQLFNAFSLQQKNCSHTVSAAHLPAPVELMDLLQAHETDTRRFQLVGRQNDLINIAGKRASMSGLTQILLDTPGVLDAVIFQRPSDDEVKTARLAALVVAPELTVVQLREHLSSRIDAVFMPRPLRLVEQLPRTSSGKLPEQDLLHFYTSNCNGA